MLETIKKSIRKRLTLVSTRLSNIKIIVKKINSDTFTSEELQNNLMIEDLHLDQLLSESL